MESFPPYFEFLEHLERLERLEHLEPNVFPFTLHEHVCTWVPGAATRAACRIGATLTKGKEIKAKVEDPGCVLAIATPCADPFTF